MSTVAVVGTGTGVGKTHVVGALALALRAAGHSVAALKPVETGYHVEDERSDARLLSTCSQFHVKQPLYGFRRPVSPHLAAREQGVEIDLPAIVDWVERASDAGRIVLVETAGGLFSPLSARTSNAHLVRALGTPTVVLVAPDRLGVLHDVGAAVLATSALPIAVDGVVLSAPERPDESTGTNADELELLGRGPVVARFPRAPLEAPATASQAARLAAWITAR